MTATLEYRHLVGMEFEHGKRDCYEIGRDFFRDNFGIELRSYVRPDRWWDHDLNLYMDHFHREGFQIVDSHPSEWRLADVALMAIMSPVANHCGIFVEPNQILHHIYGGLSRVEHYRGIWRQNTVAVLRHKDVDTRLVTNKANYEDFLPFHVRKKLEEKADRGPGEGRVRGEGEPAG